MIDKDKFTAFLRKTNKSANTTTSYLYALEQFKQLHGDFTARNLRQYKTYLIENYKPKTVNIRLLAMNAYAVSIHKQELKMSMVKIQQKPFLENVISDADYTYFKRKLNNKKPRLVPTAHLYSNTFSHDHKSGLL